MKADREKEFVDRIAKLYTPVVSDVLDELGVRDNVMSGEIRPIYPEAKVAGLAYTMRSSATVEYRKSQDILFIEALDRIARNAVIVHEVGSATNAAAWGEMCSATAMARGALGAVTNGAIRDATKITEMRFPVFARSFTPADSTIASAGLARMQLIDCQMPVRCGGVIVNPGDIIFADLDGIAVVPKNVVDEVVKRAEEKAKEEKEIRKALNKGEHIKETLLRYARLEK